MLRLSDSNNGAGASAHDQKMMRAAIDLAKEAWSIGEVPVGALVYRGDEILGRGHNLREDLCDPTAHAEIIAIREAADKLGEWRLNDCTLVVTLEPCPMCAGAIVNGRVGRLVYGASDPKAGAVETLYKLCTDHRLNHRVEVVSGVMAGECSKLLKDFFRERRKANRAKRAC
ncbi:MAG: tRNA adenosine(34) deaminase TadA [Phycisphaerales bacterium]